MIKLKRSLNAEKKKS